MQRDTTVHRVLTHKDMSRVSSQFNPHLQENEINEMMNG